MLRGRNSLENTYTSDIIQTEKVVFRDTYTSVTAINEKRGHEFEKSKEG